MTSKRVSLDDNSSSTSSLETISAHLHGDDVEVSRAFAEPRIDATNDVAVSAFFQGIIETTGPYRRGAAARPADVKNALSTTFAHARLADKDQRANVMARSANAARRAFHFVFGTTFRKRNAFEDDETYKVAWRAHYYDRWARVVYCAFALLLVYVVWRVYYMLAVDKSYGVHIEVVTPVSESLLETPKAREQYKWHNRLALYSFPCNANQSNPLTRSRSLAHDEIVCPMIEQPEKCVDLAEAKLFARRFLGQNDENKVYCVCGPMAGIGIRYIAVRKEFNEPDTHIHLTHLLNPVNLDAAAYEKLPDGDPAFVEQKIELRVQRHSQSALFRVDEATPRFIDNTTDVEIIRQAAIRISAQDEQGRLMPIQIFEDSEAACIAECLDLLDGVSIWHRAARQERAERTLLGALPCLGALRPPLPKEK